MFTITRYKNVINVSVNNFDLGEITITTQNAVNAIMTIAIGFGTSLTLIVINCIK